MQKFYSKPNDIYLPYCADPVWHSPLEREKEYDVCLIGLQYQNRTDLVNRLRAKGLKVFYETGIVYDEYQEMYAKSKVALSWSSLQDLIARVFEGMLMKVPVVCNRVPDLDLHFKEDEHYYGFSTVMEAEFKIKHALMMYEEAAQVAEQAHEVVMEHHLYDHRIQQILEDFDLV
jgi:spore maturation protein CgeB